ncbi:MAG TPA: hypothetical protein VFE46_08780 [Pirellulales bacterium]|jgi:hypothetical protein|nr:hypothetical protein [Pirellulales bacterium]
MNELPAVILEQDARFPTGMWTGFFLQYWWPGRHTTDLDLTCGGGQLSGRGSDAVGGYTMQGSYDVATGKCEWIKHYIGRHSVVYRGINNGNGMWGVWEIRQLGGLYTDRGGFHLWPKGQDVSAESDDAEQALLQVMRKEFGSKAFRAARALLVLAGIGGGVALLWNYLLGY